MKAILIVDDELDFAETVASILQSEGYTVVAVAGVTAAFEQMEKSLPDLLLVDLMMPVIGGLEMLKKMRAEPTFRTVPVVLMSASKEPARTHGLYWLEFLSKPFDIETMLSIVSKALQPEVRESYRV
jgi:CheY-like chemotaxis protein